MSTNEVSAQLDMATAVSQLAPVSGVAMKIQPSEASTLVMEDTLSQLDTTDKHFQSKELIHDVQTEDTVTDPSGVVSDTQNPATKITEEILNSSECTPVYPTFVSDLKFTLDEMFCDESLLSQQVLVGGQDPTTASSSCSTATQYYNLDDSATSSELLSVHQTGLMFMSAEQLQSLTSALQPTQLTQARIDSMRHLLQFPPGDLVSCDNWSPLNSAIRGSLMGDSKQLADLCLEFYNRMFAAHLSSTTKCVYQALAEEMLYYFECTSKSIANGMDISNETYLRLLEMCRLLNHAQLVLPSFWLRYNEKVVVTVIELTVELLAVSYRQSTVISPLHLLVLLDPTANWFRKWMHGQYSRKHLVRALKNNRSVMEGLISAVMLVDSHKLPRLSKQGSRRLRMSSITTGSLYNDKSLNYLVFVHSVSMLERLLLYTEGRKLFPVTVKRTNTKVSVSDLLCHLVRLLYSVSRSSTLSSLGEQPQLSLSPDTIISRLFEEIASGNTACKRILCDSSLILLMVEPLKVSTVLAQGLTSSNSGVSYLMGEVVSSMASTENGRQFLLHRTRKRHLLSSSKDAPVHSIANFVVECLSSLASDRLSMPASIRVVIVWLFVCRHLYSTSDGLLMLENYQLHKHISKLWNKIKKYSKMMQKDNAEAMEEALVDNLLNFAATPKGLLLLNQSGLMGVCTAYMQQRYTLKLQVSKHEKFGYGCMVTQLAATTTGIVELIKCGFVSMLVEELWLLLDRGNDDYRLTTPRAHPLDPMDRTFHKAIINLLNVLSTSVALCKVLQEKSSKPFSTLHELLKYCVFKDLDIEEYKVADYREAHLFSLRIVSVLVSCLDSLLLLDSQYKLIHSLLSQQQDSRISSAVDSNPVVIDECSIERNRILVACYCIGGPSERVLPPHYLTKPEEQFSWPLFSSYPPPSVYQQPIPQIQSDPQSEVLEYLNTNSFVDVGLEKWLAEIRKLFKKELKDKIALPAEVITTLVLKVVECLASEVAVFPLSNELSFAISKLSESEEDLQLSDINELGIELSVRYFQSIVSCSDQQLDQAVCRKHLTILVKQVMIFLRQQMRPDSADVFSLGEVGFDWFVSSVFILMRGSLDLSFKLIVQFSTIIQSCFLWYNRVRQSIHFPPDVAYNGISPIIFNTAHFVDHILQLEVPSVSSAIKLSGYAVSQICQRWLKQCFWNYLDWPEISNYLAVCVLYGVDYQVYCCVSILKFLQRRILRITQEQNLMVFLKEEGIEGYHCAEWLDYMQVLEKKYRYIILPVMNNISIT